jgi:predicted outer membrane repeat protein
MYLDSLSRTLIMSSSNITNNQALQQGGAMFAAKDATLSLRDRYVCACGGGAGGGGPRGGALGWRVPGGA